jgi:protein O-GlcNAc transferase
MSIFIDEAEAQFRQGMGHAKGRDYVSAERCFRRVTEIDPAHSAAHHNLGTALAAQHRHKEAVGAFARALEIAPSYAQAHFGLGVSLRALGRDEEAIASLARALQHDPNHDEAYYYLGLAHQEAGRLNEALACYLRAADLSPNDADVHTALASVLVRLQLPGAAARALEKALSLDPDDDLTRVHLMDQLAADCDWARLEAFRDSVPRIGIAGGPVPPFTMLTFDDDPHRHRLRSENFAATLPPIQPLSPSVRPTGRPERLRIGYFSADFHDHATMFLAARLFELHDRDRFTIHAYSFGTEERGIMRERALAAFDEFTGVGHLSNRAIAELARQDGIDVAIDLKGYAEFHRIGIFAYRPAPLQMSYLGYPGTLGAPFIDYLIADKIVVPKEYRDAYSECLIVLPHSYQANDDTRALPVGDTIRAAAGLPEEGFVFCCFNYSYKLSPVEFGIWMDLLKQVEGSVLWLLASPGNMQTHLQAEMVRKGVDPRRLVIAPRTDVHSHLSRLQLADLFLDTFNCNAHTTASDALWVAVPIITKAGKSFAARVAASLLHAVGLNELVTDSEQGYGELALALATDADRLSAIRYKLAASRDTAPLFDSRLFTRHFEAGLDLAYQRYLDGLEPADIVVPPVQSHG